MVKTKLSTASVIDGVNYIFSKTDNQNKPAVVNLSITNHFGPHDCIRSGLEHLFRLGAFRFGITGSDNLSAGAGLKLGNFGSADLLDQIRVEGVYRWQPDLGNSYILSFAAKL